MRASGLKLSSSMKLNWNLKSRVMKLKSRLLNSLLYFIMIFMIENLFVTLLKNKDSDATAPKCSKQGYSKKNSQNVLKYSYAGAS